MPFPLLIPLIMAGLGAGGGALANRGRTYTGSQNGTSTTTPTLDPAFGPLQQQLLQSIMGRLSSPTSLEGYENLGIGKINRAYDLVSQSQNNNLTARGLGASPIAANVDATRDLSRAGEVGRFQAGLPLVQRDLQNQDFGLANMLLSQGRGSTTTSTGTQTQTTPGNMLGGALGGLGQMLGFLMGQGAFGGGNRPFAGSPSFSN